MLKQTRQEFHSPRVTPETRSASPDAVRQARDKALMRLLRAWLPLLLAVAGYPSPSIGQHQQTKDQHRKTDTPSQRLDGTMADTAIPQKKEQPGKQAAHYTDQHENNDEL